MRRTTFVALAVFAVVALATPAAHAGRPAHASKTYSSTSRFFQQHAANSGGVSIIVNVGYANKHRNAKFTARSVYLAIEAPVSCQLGGSTAADVRSGPFKLRHNRVVFSGTFTDESPANGKPNPGSSGLYYATGRLIKTKNKKKWRVEGTVTVLAYDFPPSFVGCASSEIPYSATQCRWTTPTALPFCTQPYSAPDQPSSSRARRASLI